MISRSILDNLQRALQLEYSMIVHYPRLAGAVKNAEIKDLIVKLGQDSIAHASVVSSAIQAIGEEPYWSLEPLPEGADLITIFTRQLEKEKLARQLHEQNSKLAVDRSLKEKFSEIAETETSHMKIVEAILLKLKALSPGA